jgi:hypothetical protein
MRIVYSIRKKICNLYRMNNDVNNMTNMPSYDLINNLGANPWVLIFLTGIVLVYYGIFSSLDMDNTTTSSYSMSILGGIAWGLLCVLILLNAVHYFFGIDISASIKNIFTTQPEIDISVEMSESVVPEIKIRKQVFHVPDNNLVYDDAKAMCSAYGARLATYDEIETAYNKGGEWCSYGWSADQLALFPTQKQTWDTLQTTKGHENDCGRPGVNGGFIDNKMARFGANCFGYKPKITSSEKYEMDNTPLYPITKQEVAFEQRVDYWKNKLPEVDVSPFNKTTWSKL